jgi:hypothetical protein
MISANKDTNTIQSPFTHYYRDVTNIICVEYKLVDRNTIQVQLFS